MAKTTQQFDLSRFKQNPDGSFSKISTPQPRESSWIKTQENKLLLNIKKDNSKIEDIIWSKTLSTERIIKVAGEAINPIHKITLTLFGIPLPKQSVRSSNGHFWQPQKTVDRKKDYQRQIKEQLPKDFVKFTTEVHLRKFHCIFPPLKGFHKIKGRMDAIRNGEIFYKNTKPDLIDNLKKLCFDSLEDVISNDSIIVTENNTAKYYGIGGCIIIELSGY